MLVLRDITLNRNNCVVVGRMVQRRRSCGVFSSWRRLVRGRSCYLKLLLEGRVDLLLEVFLLKKLSLKLHISCLKLDDLLLQLAIHLFIYSSFLEEVLNDVLLTLKMMI